MLAGFSLALTGAFDESDDPGARTSVIGLPRGCRINHPETRCINRSAGSHMSQVSIEAGKWDGDHRPLVSCASTPTVTRAVINPRLYATTSHGCDSRAGRVAVAPGDPGIVGSVQPTALSDPGDGRESCAGRTAGRMSSEAREVAAGGFLTDADPGT